jgi:hypothetical protein
MRHRETFLVTFLAVAAVVSPAAAAKPAPCPDDASWQGQPPPLGTGYYCARTRPDGQPQRHGWAVLYHPTSQSKSEECEYREGVRHGRCTLYDEWGEIQERGTFSNGAPSGPWWYWSLPMASGRLRTLVVPPTEPEVATVRRQVVEAFIVEQGADAAESVALTEALLNYADHEGAERRQVCGQHLCVAPGMIPREPIFVSIAPTPAQVERDRALLTALEASARKSLRDEARAIKAEQRRKAQEEAQERAREAREQAQARTRARKTVEKADEEEAYEPPTRQCCKYCDSGKPCGDSCISVNKTCRKGRGCAC